jgi:hypothetical protein
MLLIYIFVSIIQGSSQALHIHTFSKYNIPMGMGRGEVKRWNSRPNQIRVSADDTLGKRTSTQFTNMTVDKTLGSG